MAQRVLDGGQGLANPGVVEYAAILGERHIKVHPHENAVVIQGQIADGKFADAFTMQNSLPMSAHSGLLYEGGRPPATDSRRDAGAKLSLQALAADEVDEVANAARIAPFVVVPGDNLHQVAVD